MSAIIIFSLVPVKEISTESSRNDYDAQVIEKADRILPRHQKPLREAIACLLQTQDPMHFKVSKEKIEEEIGVLKKTIALYQNANCSQEVKDSQKVKGRVQGLRDRLLLCQNVLNAVSDSAAAND